MDRRLPRWAFVGAMVLLLGVLAFLVVRRTARLDQNASGPRFANTEPDAKVFAAYSGSQTCRECHQSAFDAWKTSHHAQAERSHEAALDQGAFEPARSFKHGSQISECRSTNGRLEIVTAGFGGERKAFSVARVIGVEPLKQF